MAQEGYANNATSTLNGSITNSATTLSVQSGEGARFPTSDFDIVIGTEIIHVGSRSTDAFNSLTRGAQGTTAASHSGSDPVKHVLTRDSLKRLGTVIHNTGAHGSRPGASLEGQLYFPNDGSDISRDTGSLWVPWGPIYPFTAPVDGDFSWVNQGSATVTTSHGGILLKGDGTGSGGNNRLRVKTAPATPYVITAYMNPCIFKKSFHTYGLCFRQSSDGKLHTFYVIMNGTTANFGSSKWSSATAFSADYQSIPTEEMPRWLRIADDGTNRICSYSVDGQVWSTFHSVGRTDFLTANQVGFFVGTENAATPNLDTHLHLLSWKES